MMRIRACGAIVAAALIVAAGRPAGAQEQAGGQAKASAGSERRRIGVLCPAEGRFAMLGESFLRGASIALK
jgi:hypothetical protein